jgi:hypothetical protein
MFSENCTNLIKNLMMRNPFERLGVLEGATEIKSHPWFSGVDW